MIEKNIKLCSKCGKYPREERQRYCKRCRSAYNKGYKASMRANYIYIFKPIEEEYKGELLYIGSTSLLSERMSKHLTLRTSASKKIKELNREFNIHYTVLEDNITREELYFIEYFLIHQYYIMQGLKPLGNEVETMQTDITQERQLELIKLVCSGLEYKLYNMKSHKKNAFIS